jgi:hypothetical protein
MVGRADGIAENLVREPEHGRLARATRFAGG